MYFHFNMRRVKCLKYWDAGAHGEYYFTWRAQLADADGSKLAQGFSLGCPANSGYSMRAGSERSMNDPKFSLELPDVKEGEQKLLVLDLFAWESDFGTLSVKKAFTNEAAVALIDLAQASQESKDKLLKDFGEWVGGDKGVVTSLVAAGAMAASGVVPFVAISQAALKAVTFAVDAVRSNNDDFLGHARLELLYTRKNNKRYYRYIFNNGASVWKDRENEPFHDAWRVEEANGGNVLDCRFLVQVIDVAQPDLIREKMLPDAIEPSPTLLADGQ